MARRTYLLTRDLLFRARLDTVVSQAGGVVTRDATACDLGVVDLSVAEWEPAIRDLRAQGVRVLAFGPHVDVARLRGAQSLGAEAVPNSQVARRLAELLES